MTRGDWFDDEGFGPRDHVCSALHEKSAEVCAQPTSFVLHIFCALFIP